MSSLSRWSRRGGGRDRGGRRREGALNIASEAEFVFKLHVMALLSIGMSNCYTPLTVVHSSVW